MVYIKQDLLESHTQVVKFCKSAFLVVNILGDTVREWRRSGGLQQNIHGANQAVHDAVLSPTISASRKKQKVAPPASVSFGAPSPSFHPQEMTTTNQPSSSAAKRGHIAGAKGKKHKSVSWNFHY